MLKSCRSRLLEMEIGMKRKLVAKNIYDKSSQQRIVELCFDDKSIDGFKPGLKMIFALDDPPLFVRLEEVETDPYNAIFRW